MEIGENGDKSVIHSVASVPVLFSSREEESSQDNVGGHEKRKNRRVSFAASSQFLEPINPFDVLGKVEKSLLSLIFVNREQIRFYTTPHVFEVCFVVNNHLEFGNS
jgi:hypothetical protein